MISIREKTRCETKERKCKSHFKEEMSSLPYCMFLKFFFSLMDRNLVLKYLSGLGTKEAENELWYWTTEHLRMSGIYWTLMSLSLLNSDLELAAKRTDLLDFVRSCQDPVSSHR